LRSLKTGDLVFIRYKDDVLFKGSDASEYELWTQGTVDLLPSNMSPVSND